MRILDRFVGYGLAGGFFWAGQIILFVIFAPSFWLNNIASLIPSVLATSANSFLAALGIIAIFFTGVLLDQFVPSAYTTMQIIKFRKELFEHQHWLLSLFKKYDAYFNEGLEVFSLDTKQDEEEWWKQVTIRSNASDQSQTIKNRITRVYHLYWGWLYSYSLMAPNAPQLDVLSDRMQMWRTLRAFSTATIVLLIELILLITLFLSIVIVKWGQQHILFVGILGAIGLIVGAGFLVVKLGPIAIAHSTKWFIKTPYSRLCEAVFSLAYLVSIQADADHSSEQQGVKQGDEEVASKSVETS